MNEILGERDLRAVMSVIEDARRDDPTEALPWAMLEGLAQLVGCDAVNFPEVDLANRHDVMEQWLDDDGSRGFDVGDSTDPRPPDYWKYLKEFLPCTYAERTGDLVSVVQWSDFYTRRELRNTRFFSEVATPSGTIHALHASFPALPGHFRKVSFWRDVDLEFSKRDRLIVQLLRPHIWEVYLDSQRRRQNVPRLSPREWEVLSLAHRGYGNNDIASELFISVATVRKHFEHIFDRTGVRTRAAAAALMMPHYSPIHASTGHAFELAGDNRLPGEVVDVGRRAAGAGGRWVIGVWLARRRFGRSWLLRIRRRWHRCRSRSLGCPWGR
jgi:DNA-binding CsgD family transcriptional regulator